MSHCYPVEADAKRQILVVHESIGVLILSDAEQNEKAQFDGVQ